MIFSSMHPSVSLSSTWMCAPRYYGTVEWYIHTGPTAASATVSFDVVLPFDAVIKRAWLTMGLNSPLTGSAYKHMNGAKIPASGEMDVEGIEASTTRFDAVFSFRANGAVYQNTEIHESVLTITDPTLHIEYTSVSHPDEEPEGPDVIVGRPLDSGVQLPRLLGKDFREVARIAPVKLALTLNLPPLSKATMNVPPGEHEIKVRDFLELFSPHGSAGLFRVTEVATSYGSKGGQTVYLEHAFGTLADSLAIGTQSMSAPVATVIATLLETQNERHWVLGDCEIPEDYELIYDYSYDNLLQAITNLTKHFPDGYAWEFDTTRYPFVMHLRKMPDDDSCECRMNRNLTSATLTIDASSLCTRVLPFGAGEGTDRMTLTNLTGSQHLDSPNAEVWGYVSRTFTAEDIYDAITLRDVAQRYLDRYDHPLVSVRMDAMDLARATGESFDRFRLGRVCRLALPDYGVTMRERVIQTKWPDVYGKPQKVDVTLANRIRTASDEIAELMREATNSKILGGQVITTTKEGFNDEVTPTAVFIQYFDVEGYGNLISVIAEYTASEGGYCTMNVDGINVVPAEEAQSLRVNVTKYLKADENGVPVVGRHYVSYAATVSGPITVSGKLTIKTIEKR